MKCFKDLEKALRANLKELSSKHYVGLSSDEMADVHLELIKDILAVGKPVKSQLQCACNVLYGDASKDERLRFVDSLWLTLQHCRSKSKSMTSGKKLHTAVAQIAKFIKDVSAQPPVESTAVSPARVAPPKVEPASERDVPARDSVFPIKKRRSEPLCFESPKVSKLQAELESVFGRSFPLKTAVDLSCSPMSIVSSACSPSKGAGGGSSSSALPPPLQYVDVVAQCVVRAFADGHLDKAVMTAGPAGFAIAQFLGEPPFESELPNVIALAKPVLDQVSNKAVRKKPAGRFAGGQVAQAQDEGRLVQAPDTPQTQEDVEDLEPAAEDGQEEEGEEDDDAAASDADSIPAAVSYPEPAAQIITERKFHGELLTLGQFAKQSYIQEKVGKKRILVVAVSSSQSENHKVVAQAIFDDLRQRACFTKADALNLRSSKLSN